MKDVQSVVSTVMELNINQTIPLQYYRMQFNSYLEEVSSKLKKLFMSELKETVGFKLDQDGCVSQLVSVAHLSVWDGLVKGLLPFILFDTAKILLCAGIAAAVHKRVEAKQHTGHPVKSRQAL